MLRTRSRRLMLTLAAGLLTISQLSAQGDAIRNWAAPLYWQPSEREAALMREGREARTGIREPETTSSMDTAVTMSAVVTTPPLVFVGMTPCRMMDTRGYDAIFTGPYGPPAMGGSSSRALPVAGVTAGHCSVPSAAQAVSVNLTLWPNPGSAVNYATIWPVGQPFPTQVSTLNDTQGVQGVSNAAVAVLGSGAFNIFVSNTTDLFIDVNGYYVAPTALALGAGTAGAPALTFSNDANSGLYSPSAGKISVATAGVDRMTVDASGNVGIGALTPGSKLDVAGDINFTGVLRFQGTPILREPVGGESFSNIGLGAGALPAITSGSWNTAIGTLAMTASTTGSWNTAVGRRALEDNTSGNYNTAIGWEALDYIVTGSSNIGIGQRAGFNLSSASSGNIMIGSSGSSTDNNAIRIGAGGHAAFFAAGIRGITTGVNNAIPVVIDSSGQLGTVSSSRSVKRDIRNMGDTTGTIMGLRPVRFRYRVHSADSPEQYGLVAEEVADIAPDLVAHNADGQVETVYYDKVNAMLLNEVQKQHRVIEAQSSQLQRQQSVIESLEFRLTELENQR